MGEKDNEFCAVIETCAEQLRALSHGGVVLAGAQTPTLVMSGLMGSPGSALREKLFPCPLCSLDSEQRASSTPCALWGASFDERWGVKDGLPLQAMIICSLLDSGLPAWSAQFLGLVATENVFIGMEKLNLYLLRVWSPPP